MGQRCQFTTSCLLPSYRSCAPPVGMVLPWAGTFGGFVSFITCSWDLKILKLTNGFSLTCNKGIFLIWFSGSLFQIHIDEWMNEKRVFFHSEKNLREKEKAESRFHWRWEEKRLNYGYRQQHAWVSEMLCPVKAVRRKEYIRHESIYMKFWNRQKQSALIENRSVVIWGWARD